MRAGRGGGAWLPWLPSRRVDGVHLDARVAPLRCNHFCECACSLTLAELQLQQVVPRGRRTARIDACTSTKVLRRSLRRFGNFLCGRLLASVLEDASKLPCRGRVSSEAAGQLRASSTLTTEKYHPRCASRTFRTSILRGTQQLTACRALRTLCGSGADSQRSRRRPRIRQELRQGSCSSRPPICLRTTAAVGPWT